MVLVVAEVSCLPDTPIGKLIFLICIEVGKFLEQEGQASALVSEDCTRMVSVKQANDIQTEVSLEPDDIHECTMKDLKV